MTLNAEHEQVLEATAGNGCQLRRSTQHWHEVYSPGSVDHSMGSKVAKAETSNFVSRRVSSYPIGVIVRARVVSGIEIEAQITKIETTALGRFLHVEYGDEVANITARQIYRLL